LQKVTPIYEGAVKAVNSLKGSDVTELKNFKTATPPVQLVAKALCLFFNTKPNMVAGPDGKTKVPEYWDPCKKNVLTSALLKQLKEYPKDSMSDDLVNTIQPVINEDLFAEKVLEKASIAALGISRWCRAIIGYHFAMKVVTPVKLELAAAKESSAAAQKAWDEAKSKLAAVQAEMKKLVDELEATQAEETRLRNEKDDCERKVELAKALINGLANERENWKVDLAKNREARENIVGDVVIASGVIAYLGVFLKNYRDECTQQWADMLRKFDIGSTKNVSVEAVCGDAVKIR
jgi:dynein heavy chain